MVVIVAMQGSDRIERTFNLSVATSTATGDSTTATSGTSSMSETEEIEHPWDSYENEKDADYESFEHMYALDEAILGRDITETEDSESDFDFPEDASEDYSGYSPGSRSLLSYSAPADRPPVRGKKKIVDPNWERDRKLAHRSRINREMHELTQPPLFPWELNPSSITSEGNSFLYHFDFDSIPPPPPKRYATTGGWRKIQQKKAIGRLWRLPAVRQSPSR